VTIFCGLELREEPSDAPGFAPASFAPLTAELDDENGISGYISGFLSISGQLQTTEDATSAMEFEIEKVQKRSVSRHLRIHTTVSHLHSSSFRPRALIWFM